MGSLALDFLIVVAALTAGVAAVSFATSYGALYAYARDTGLYSDRLTRLWSLLLDGAFIVAQLAAILAGLLATYGRIALLSPEGDVFDQMAGRYNQAAGPNLGVYLKGHAGDLLRSTAAAAHPNTSNGRV